jgi:signal transduction histidine kinase
MFRSLFARMLITISTVLTVSFLILSVIPANFANEYELEKREADLERTATAAAELLTEGLGLSENAELTELLSSSPARFKTLFRVYLSNTEETVLLLCSREGTVLLSERGNTEEPDYTGVTLPREVTEAALFSTGYHGSADLFGTGERRLLCTQLLGGEGDAALGFVVTFSTVESFGGLTMTLIRTVLLASLWIILGALVILYLFCERVAGPLREMGHVTKRFAKGDFTSRVTVVGNDEISTLGIAFNQMADSLDQLETMRNSFISNVSHDLRTPMTTILGFIEGITSGVIPEEKHTYYLGVIAEEIRRLSRLVTELLDLSRLQSGTRKFNFTNFDICEMARLVLIANEQRIDEKRLEVAFEAEADNLLVSGDRDAIHQVLYNLCDNAIKFSKEAGTLRISIASLPKHKVAVTVFNEGDGIPEADIPFVFDRFYKSDKSRSRDKTGAGLGLYISKTIMEAHGEGLTLESVEGEFCAFTLTLPAVES